MFNSVLEDNFDQDKLVLLYRNLFLESKKKGKVLTNDSWFNIRISNAITLVRYVSYLFIINPNVTNIKKIEFIKNTPK